MPGMTTPGITRILSVFPAQMREQDHIADIGRVGNQHHQAIDADAASAGRRQAILQSANVIGVVIHRLFISGILGGDLRLKARGLIFRIVQLRKTVGDFAAGDEQFEAFSNAGNGIGCARQWRDFDRIVDDVGRFPQLRLGGFFKQ